MKQYYKFLYNSDETKISQWLGQGVYTGVYTLDFLGMLLSCTPYNEMMDISAGLQNANFFKQMDLFAAWSKERVERILNMKNMCLTVQDMGGKHQKQPDKKLLTETARKIMIDTLKKSSPTLAQINPPSAAIQELP